MGSIPAGRVTKSLDYSRLFYYIHSFQISIKSFWVKFLSSIFSVIDVVNPAFKYNLYLFFAFYKFIFKVD